MKRPNLYLVIEDGGERTDELYRALRDIKNQGCDVTLDHERRVSRLLGQKSLYTVDDLAAYDAFFVDFHLSTEKNFEVPAKLTLPIGNELEEVTLTTGIGVLLYLTNLIKSEEYMVARDRHAKILPRESRRPALYAFVELKALQSRFYAAAARSWFGADYFRATPRSSVLAEQLMDLDGWRTGREATIVRNAVEPFNRLMDCKLDVTRSAWGSIPEAYDWLRFYYQAGGARGGKAGFKTVVTREMHITPTWTSATIEYADREMNPIQQAMRDFLQSYRQGEGDKWPTKFSLTERDRMFEVLRDSESFWMEPDVGFAMRAHRAQQRSTGRSA